MARKAIIAAPVAVMLLSLALTAPRAGAAPSAGIHNIQHVVMIMQENRSFDSYFGTFPGANGIPAGVCVPDPAFGGCVKPFHTSNDKNGGGPHGHKSAIGDINGGQMNGFVSEVEKSRSCTGTDPRCSGCVLSEPQTCHEVMAYHDAREIPNYWTYAKQFVLQDNMFASVLSWSQPEHNFLVSGWAARCPLESLDPMECKNDFNDSPNPRNWTDITYLLAKAGVSWRYYVYEGTEPDCESDEAVTCAPVKQGPKTPGPWNPLINFTDVNEDAQRANIQSLNAFYGAVHTTSSCGLPNVTWVEPNQEVSEHPPGLVSRGQAYVTTLVNAIMRSPCWGSTAIFVSWDDWGGLYDHVKPPSVDINGYGLRVPYLVISPYAKPGYIDHQLLSHDAYLKFIEDDFLEGARLNPATDGRPDRRPDVREELPGLGDLANDFNFEQQPLPPLLLSPHPEPGPASEPPGGTLMAPTAETGSASSVTQTTATLNATVTSKGAPLSDCHFEYGTSVFYESSRPCATFPPMGSTGPASAAIEALNPNTPYHFRIVATNSAGTGYGADATFTTLPNPPVVSAVSPVAGPEAGATAVTITGENLSGASAVKFGALAATSYSVGDVGSVTATAPPGTGTVDVTVTTRGGTSATSAADRFRYAPPPVLIKLSPVKGGAGGGTTVTMGGSGFTEATAVMFGATPASSLLVTADGSITATSPAEPAGTVEVTVSTPGGTSATSSASAFKYVPTVTAVRPSGGPVGGGTSVEIAGSGFLPGAGGTRFLFGAAKASAVSCSSSSTCTLTAPAHEAGAVDVKASVNGVGSPKNSPADVFTYG